MNLPQDPGGVFETNAHRRVLGHIDACPGSTSGPFPVEKTRDTVPQLAIWLQVDHHDQRQFVEGSVEADAVEDEMARLVGDPLDEATVRAIVDDLKRDGYVSEKGETLKRTAKGTEALQR